MRAAFRAIKPTSPTREVDAGKVRGSGPSARAEEAPHLEVAHGERCLLEQPRQLTFNDLGGPQRGSIVHDKNFFMAGQRQCIGYQTASGPIVPRHDRAVDRRRDQGTGTGCVDTHGVKLRHLR
jgi:hypothetical protein